MMRTNVEGSSIWDLNHQILETINLFENNFKLRYIIANQVFKFLHIEFTQQWMFKIQKIYITKLADENSTRNQMHME